MKLLNGHLWELRIHTLKYWKVVLRDKNEPPIIPYYAFGITMPYGLYEKDGKRYIPKGVYFFPFAIRYFKLIK